MPSRRFRKRGGGDPPAEGKGFLDQTTGFVSDATANAKKGADGLVGTATSFLSDINPFGKKEPAAPAPTEGGRRRRKTKRRRAKRRTRR